jgi:hypothetical protein
MSRLIYTPRGFLRESVLILTYLVRIKKSNKKLITHEMEQKLPTSFIPVNRIKEMSFFSL